MFGVPEVQPIMIADVETELGIFVEDKLCFRVDSAARGEHRQMIACNVVDVLCLVQASFNGIDVEPVAWEHLRVNQDSDFSRQVKKMSLWSRFGCAVLTRIDFGELQSGLLCRLRCGYRCAERRRAGSTSRASLPRGPASWRHRAGRRVDSVWLCRGLVSAEAGQWRCSEWCLVHEAGARSSSQALLLIQREHRLHVWTILHFC